MERSIYSINLKRNRKPLKALPLRRPPPGRWPRFWKRKGKTGYGLRLAVTAGGCSGYNYGLYFEESANPEDKVFSAEGFDVFVDPQSYPVIAGTEIDFLDGLQGSGFKINNPNAMSMCGCGKSFTT